MEKSKTTVLAPCLPQDLQTYSFLQMWPDQKARTRSECSKCYYDSDELACMPDPNDLANSDCGVCYACIQMRGKPCQQPGIKNHQDYAKWYSNISILTSTTLEQPTDKQSFHQISIEDDETIPEDCLGCETGCDADGPHRIFNGNYHPNCCTLAAEKERADFC